MAIEWQKQSTGNYKFQNESIQAFYGGIDGDAWWRVNDTMSKIDHRCKGYTETVDQARLEAEFAIIGMRADRKSNI